MLLYENMMRQKLNLPSKLSGVGVRTAARKRPRRWASASDASASTATSVTTPARTLRRMVFVFYARSL
jgi:hypothetical protein